MNTTFARIIQAVALTFIITVSSADASVTLTIDSAGWGNSTTTATNGMTWGILVNTTGSFDANTISTLQTALQGFSIPSTASPSTPVQIGSTGFYFAVAQNTTSNSGPGQGFTNGYMGTDYFNLTGVNTGNPFGLLWFSDGSTTQGSHFGFQVPTGTNTLPSDGATVITGNINTTPSLGSYTIGAAPEPSRAILALLGIGLLSLRRRRFFVSEY